MGSFHARTLAAIAGAQVAVIADPFGDTAAALAAELGAQTTRDPESVATDSSLDAVVIASPDETHASLTRAAMAAGLRVLCEKPLATTVADAQAVVDAEVALGQRVVQLGFMREYDMAHRQLVDAIAGDIEGGSQIQLMRSLHRNTSPEPRTDLAVVGQSGVHDIHSIRFITGQEIEAVTAYATRRGDGSLRHIVLMCELAGGGHAMVEFDDDGFGYEVAVDVTIGSATVSTAAPARPIERRNASVATTIGRDWFGWFADAYRTQDAAWVDSLSAPAAFGPSAWDGLVAQIVVHAALTSLDQGGRVAVDLPAWPDLFGSTRDRIVASAEAAERDLA